jgi:hypothetical protein
MFVQNKSNLKFWYSAALERLNAGYHWHQDFDGPRRGLTLIDVKHKTNNV